MKGRSSLHAGYAVPGMRRYVVTDAHYSKGLTEGNIVVVVEDPKSNNWLLRLSDLSLHHLTGQSDQYVHLEPVPEANGTQSKAVPNASGATA
jgi:hypothetical protein